MILPRKQLWMGPTTYLGKGSRQKRARGERAAAEEEIVEDFLARG